MPKARALYILSDDIYKGAPMLGSQALMEIVLGSKLAWSSSRVKESRFKPRIVFSNQRLRIEVSLVTKKQM